MPTLRDAHTAEAEITEMTAEDLRGQIDREARRILNISGEEFAERWHRGDYRDATDPRITQVAMLLPDAW